MDALIEQAGRIVLGYGMPGVIIIALLYDRWRILGELRTFTEARIQEGLAAARLLTEATAIMREAAEGQQEAAAASRTMAASFDAMAKAFERLADRLDRRR